MAGAATSAEQEAAAIVIQSQARRMAAKRRVFVLREARSAEHTNATTATTEAAADTDTDAQCIEGGVRVLRFMLIVLLLLACVHAGHRAVSVAGVLLHAAHALTPPAEEEAAAVSIQSQVRRNAAKRRVLELKQQKMQATGNAICRCRHRFALLLPRASLRGCCRGVHSRKVEAAARMYCCE